MADQPIDDGAGTPPTFPTDFGAGGDDYNSVSGDSDGESTSSKKSAKPNPKSKRKFGPPARTRPIIKAGKGQHRDLLGVPVNTQVFNSEGLSAPLPEKHEKKLMKKSNNAKFKNFDLEDSVVQALEKHEIIAPTLTQAKLLSLLQQENLKRQPVLLESAYGTGKSLVLSVWNYDTAMKERKKELERIRASKATTMRANESTEDEIEEELNKITTRAAENTIRPIAILLLPNNGLCRQAQQFFNSINDSLPSTESPLVVDTYYGGGGYPKRDEDGNFLQVDIAIGTPGRMLEILAQDPRMDCSRTAFVSIDETHAMLYDYVKRGGKMESEKETGTEQEVAEPQDPEQEDGEPDAEQNDGEDTEGKEHMRMLINHLNAMSNNGLRFVMAGPSLPDHLVEAIVKFSVKKAKDDSTKLLHVKVDVDDGAATDTKLVFVNCKDPKYAPNGARNPPPDDQNAAAKPYLDCRDAAFIDVLMDPGVFVATELANITIDFNPQASLCLASDRGDVHHMTDMLLACYDDEPARVRKCMGYRSKHDESKFRPHEAQDSIDSFIAGDAWILNSTIGFSLGHNFSNTPVVYFYKLEDLHQFLIWKSRVGRNNTEGLGVGFIHPDDDRDLIIELVPWLKKHGHPVPEFMEEVAQDAAAKGDTGSRGKKAGRECHNCGEVGHKVKDCPTQICHQCKEPGHHKDTCSNPWVPTCRTCGENGHVARDCPQIQCFKCKQHGHHKDHCTNEPAVECRTCHKIGHVSKECPDRECQNCGEKGHFRQDCKVIKCRNCDEIGHLSGACSLAKDWTRVKCNHCGQMGHYAGKCNNPKKKADAGDEGRSQRNGGGGRQTGGASGSSEAASGAMLW